MTKQLPCKLCGVMVEIPAKYAMAKGAVCSNCSPARAKAAATQKKFKLGPLQKSLLFGVGFYALFFAVMSWGAYQRCQSQDAKTWPDVSIRETKICVARFGPVQSRSWAPWK